MYRFCFVFFVFEDNFPSASPRQAYIWRGDLTEGFLRYWFGGLIFGGTHFWNFTVCLITQCHEIHPSVFVAGVSIFLASVCYTFLCFVRLKILLM